MEATITGYQPPHHRVGGESLASGRGFHIGSSPGIPTHAYEDSASEAGHVHNPIRLPISPALGDPVLDGTHATIRHNYTDPNGRYHYWTGTKWRSLNPGDSHDDAYQAGR